MSRPHPFELLFGTFRAERFPAIRAALGDSIDVNTFVLAAPALELLRELRPDEGLGDGTDDFVALVHSAYLYWRDEELTYALDEAATRALTRSGSGPSLTTHDARRTTYIQIAPRIVWGQLDTDAPFEPLDGWFATGVGEGILRQVACFGVHEQRPGVSVVAVQGAAPASTARPDGTPLFAPTMPGGDAADLHAVITPEELLLLGWRATHDMGA